MALPVYLAMTAAELQECGDLPGHMAWMACHFSSYGTGLSNLPRQLPKGSLLILNDRIPVQGHDPGTVAQQLASLAEKLEVSGILLDFQRAGNSQVQNIVRTIVGAIPCPVAVTQYYAADISCAVFLDTPRAYHPLSRLTEKWPGRELWLEASYSPGTVTVTDKYSRYEPETDFPDALPVHTEEKLHCSYCIQKSEQWVQFHFRRTPEQLDSLLKEAQTLGITKAIGLYQELRKR